ncbi:carbohydrate sulfotransferase 12-like isoform X1 [Phycodurus eques]|uniref:carbohydrate sulfotransferase 12-like isoform X1 n=1 Tax=Phycodurus eques TaxID=693459 RepID=UPI002ACE819B|nr:carbohydrate sulfotransferase 12-like isoform X1 [Phycodurus eques]
MGTWRGLHVVFIVGSLFVILLIIAYWDDVGGFNLYPLRDRKHERCPQTAAAPTLLASFAGISSTTWAPAGTTNKSAEGRDRPQLGSEDKESDESRDLAGSREQMARKRRIVDVCSGKDFPGRTRAFEQIPNRELDHLIVDDTHQIIYCYVPKVACTNWKRVMVVLSQSLVSPVSGKPYTDPESVPPDLVHNSSLHLTFAKFWRHYGSLSRHLMALKLQHYTKFLFVRDPFVRLISAFRNKFGRPNEDFYRQFGSVILRRYGNLSGSLPETAAEAFASGIKPTFQQFVSYLLDAETEKESFFNEHWRQVYRLCHPCQVKYDFIGRLETLETDADHLLKLLQVDHLLRFPSGARNRTAASWERDWFAQIPVSMRTELYKLYQPDFELFGYPEPDGVLHHQ